MADTCMQRMQPSKNILFSLKLELLLQLEIGLLTTKNVIVNKKKTSKFLYDSIFTLR